MFLRSLKDILTNGTFLRNATISTMLFAALSAWVGSSEHIVDEIYKKPQWFAWMFAGIGAWMAVCTLTNSKLTMRFGGAYLTVCILRCRSRFPDLCIGTW
jgi:MFS transporter, DHA1 family, multidrug resistance protein